MKEQILNIFMSDQMLKGIGDVDKKFAVWMQQLPREYQEMIIEVLDEVIFALANFSQQKSKILERERKILVEARLFDSSLEEIEDIRRLSHHQLEYLEDKWRTKYNNYSLVEGGVAGIGHPLGLLLDFPALLSININMIHAIAGTYGYSLRYPPEQVIALKVLHAASLPQSYEEEAWDWLLDQYYTQDDIGINHIDQGTIIQPEWLETLAKQWIKSIGLYGLRKTSKQKLSLLGALVNAGLNYQFTNRIGQFASRFYRYRFEHEQQA